MKECPICHAKNGDGSETCYNCHASLNFKVYNAYNNQNKNQGNVSNKSNNTQNMQVNDKEHICKHCGTVFFNEGSLCNKCKIKKIFLSILFIFFAIVLALIAIALMNTVLTSLFGEKTRYGVGGALIIGYIFIAINAAKTIFNKPKKSLLNSKNKNQGNTSNNPNNTKNITVKDKNNNNSNNTIKKRYCKFCGGLIDQKSKECTNCGKQYFKVPKVNMLVSIGLVIILVACNIFQFIYNNNNSNKKDIDILSFSQFIECEKTAHLKMRGKPSTTYSLLVIRDDTHAQYTSLSCNSDSKGIIEFKWNAPFRKGSYSITVSDVNDEENTETVQMQVY